MASNLHDTLAAKIKKILRAPAPYETVVLKSLPPVIVRAFILRSFFDYYYDKAGKSEAE